MQHSGVSLPHISNVPEKRFRVCRNEDEIFELPEDSNKIVKRIAVDW